MYVWIKAITGHNNLAYFQSKINPVISPTCRLCNMEDETIHNLMTTCSRLAAKQLSILDNKIPLPDLAWSIKKLMRFIQLPEVESLLDYDSEHVMKEIIYIEHNYSDDSEE